MDADRFAILTKIDTNYWREKNPYYGDYPLSPSMQASLSIIQTRGFLTGKTYKTCADLNQAIISSISQYWTISSSQKMDCALEIFDLIHAWGGRMGRNPYVLKKSGRKTFREDYLKWFNHYQDGINSAKRQNPELALSEFCRIPQIGISFGSKHLRFWGGFPILDTRVSLLLGYSLSVRYSDYFSDIKKLAEHLNLNNLEMEQALFGFSTAFFPNNQLNIKPEIDKSMHNYDEAKALENLSQRNK